MPCLLEPQQGPAQGWAHNTQEILVDWLVGCGVTGGEEKGRAREFTRRCISLGRELAPLGQEWPWEPSGPPLLGAVGQEGPPTWLRRSAWERCLGWMFPSVTETCRG